MNKRARRVGLGMKPRAEANQDAEKVNLSATEVQQVVPETAVEAAVESVPEGGAQDLSPVQNLDSKPQEQGPVAENEAIVAQTAVLEPPAADPLGELLKQSEAFVIDESDFTLNGVAAKAKPEASPKFTVQPIPGREFADVFGPSLEELARDVFENGKPAIAADATIAEVDNVTVYKKTSDGEYVEVPGGYDISYDALKELHGSPGVIQFFQSKPMGKLPNGEYRATVRIAEPYVEGCRQQAEADGVSLEDWLSNHLHSYLEAWWSAPAAK